MMGVQDAPARLFYDFDIEAHVPANHILREIHRTFDINTIRQQLAPHYSDFGRPSIEPEPIIRMLVVGYVLGICSERRLCDEANLNLAYLWFCRLDLNSKVPDHSTFSKYRHGKFRYSDLLRTVFEANAARCISESLVGGHSFARIAESLKRVHRHARPGVGIDVTVVHCVDIFVDVRLVQDEVYDVKVEALPQRQDRKQYDEPDEMGAERQRADRAAGVRPPHKTF
jgi:transposase